MKKQILVSFLLTLTTPTFAQNSDWIDLTHNFNKETVYWPTANSFILKTVFNGITPKHFYYSAKEFSAAEHGGTHMDAPIHFAENKDTVGQVPLSKLIGKGVVVNIQAKTKHHPDYLISVEDLQHWERIHGKMPQNSIVLFNTGWHKYWPNKIKYLGTGERGEIAVPHLHFPGLSPEAAKWLIDERQVKSLGIDTASIDYGQSQLFLSHQILTKHNIPFFENVANLNAVHTPFIEVIALPMKIENGTGAPARIIAREIS